MSMTFQEIKERTYLLIYGLLSEDEAEELRILVATNSEAASAFESARLTTEYFKDFTTNIPSMVQDDNASVRNVSVDSSLAPSFAFDSAVSSLDEGVFIESTDPVDLVSTSSNEDKKAIRRNRAKGRSKLKGETPSKALFQQSDVFPPNTRHDALFHGFGALFKGIDDGVGRFWALLWRSPVSTGLLATLLVLGICVTIAALRCDYLLTRRFFDDFRIQIAIPRTLARGVSQSIVVKTTGVDGSPRRVPTRFCFVDPTTGKILLNHTESGNSDGNLTCGIPDLTGFPDKVSLVVFAGASETELFKSTLRVEDFENTNVEKSVPYDPCLSSCSDGVRDLNSPILQSVLDFPSLDRFLLDADSPKGGESKSESGDSTLLSSSESERVFLHLYPESGRFVAGFTNNVCVFCSDKNGRPLARRVAFFQEDNDKPAAFFSTSERGFGSFQWTPVKDSPVIAILVPEDFNERDVHLLNPFEQGFLLEHASSDELICESPTTIEIDPQTGRKFAFFNPTISAESAYLSFDKRVFASEERLRIRLFTAAKIPIVATVEKNGVTAWQHFLTNSKEVETFDLTLPDSLSGFMKVSLYSVAQRRFLKLAETGVFRNLYSTSLPMFSAEISDSTSEDGNRLLVINQQEKSTSTAQVENKETTKVDIYWAPDFRTAFASLDVDDVLMNVDEEVRDEIVRTTPSSSLFNPPIVFDNLDVLVKNARVKLDSFKENEARSFFWIVRLVFVSCFSIALAALFFTVFRVFSLGRSFLLWLLSIGLFFFTLELQSTLNAFIQSSQDVVFAIDEEENQLPSQLKNTSKIEVSGEGSRTQTSETSETSACVRLVTAIDLDQDSTQLALENLLFPSERSSGIIFIKIRNGTTNSVKFLSLEKGL